LVVAGWWFTGRRRFLAVLDEREVSLLSKDSRILELGCGGIRRCPGSITVDRNSNSVADVIHDLDCFPYPFSDNEFDIVIAEHVLEHLTDIIKVVEELHRILKQGGVLYVDVPHFSCNDHFTDPTHKHAFGFRSFDYFVPGAGLNRYGYSPARFTKRKVVVHPSGGGILRKFLTKSLMRSYDRWEKRYAFILPADHITFELEAIK